MEYPFPTYWNVFLTPRIHVMLSEEDGVALYEAWSYYIKTDGDGGAEMREMVDIHGGDSYFTLHHIVAMSRVTKNSQEHSKAWNHNSNLFHMTDMQREHHETQMEAMKAQIELQKTVKEELEGGEDWQDGE